MSGKNLVTGGDGRASATYTAPLAPADPVDTQTVVQILATPGGTDYANATSRSVSIRLVPPGIILPPNGTPVPSFTYSPSAPLSKSDVTFDASLEHRQRRAHRELRVELRRRLARARAWS